MIFFYGYGLLFRWAFGLTFGSLFIVTSTAKNEEEPLVAYKTKIIIEVL